MVLSFEEKVEPHFYFYGAATRLGHRLFANDSSLPSPSYLHPRDWRLSLHANFLHNRDRDAFSLRDLPAHLLPFFAYKDVAIYMPSNGTDSTVELFNAMYREWYPTRDRTVFDNGLFRGCGAPFFSLTMRVQFDNSTPQLPAPLEQLVRWHVALSRQLHHLLLRFDSLEEAARLLARPPLTRPQLQNLPHFLVPVEYTPFIQPTFTECFLWLERAWKDKGVRLVVLSEGMLHKISSGEWEGLTRDVELEEQAKKAASLWAENEIERREGEMNEHVGVDDEALMDHVSVWRGSLEVVMRVVVAGDEARKRGLREFNFMLDEWLGEGVNVGKNAEPQNG